MKKYTVTGMSCSACSARVERAVSSLDGVKSCQVNLLMGTMLVDGGDEEKIFEAVINAGYGIKEEKIREEKDFGKEEVKKIRNRLLFSLGFLLALMYIAMGHIMYGLPLPSFLSEKYLLLGIIEMLLALVIIIINKKFYINGIKGVIKGAPNMDTLVSLGSGVSFVYSCVTLCLMIGESDTETLMHSAMGLYFESAAMILVLITVGKLLEAYSKGRTTDALRGLIELKPKKAIVLVNGEERELEASSLRVGDVFIVKAGSAVPTDGEIIEGDGAFDESSLTGESIPADKSSGEKIYASSILSSGYVKARATEVGEETTLAKIIKTVSDAVATKAPISKIADRVSGIFVPIVILIAVCVTVISLLCSLPLGEALSRGIAILVISCPCSLGLATPVAIMVGSGVGARKGILFKNAEILEECGKCDIVALDKTGTITKGVPFVTDIIPITTDEGELLSLAYSLEVKSEHPLARAICKKAEENGISLREVSEFDTLVGSGVAGKIDGEEHFGLSFKATKEKIKNIAPAQAHFERLAEEGKTPLFFVKNDTLLGIIAVRDEILQDSREAILTLKEMGLKVVMITGDNEKTANAVAKEVSIDHVISGVLPNEKGMAIAELKREGKVIMVGDGINDSVALAQANIGIAIGKGTDVAIDTAGIVLVKNTLKDVAISIKLSRATLRNIKENLFWAFIYNCIGIPLSALGQIPPMFGAFAMSLSSLCVVMNALRLNLFNEKRAYKRKTKNKRKEEKEMEITLKVEGMMCPHCEARVKQALEALDGVVEASPSHTLSNVVVRCSKQVDGELIRSTIEAQGYKANLQ